MANPSLVFHAYGLLHDANGFHVSSSFGNVEYTVSDFDNGGGDDLTQLGDITSDTVNVVSSLGATYTPAFVGSAVANPGFAIQFGGGNYFLYSNAAYDIGDDVAVDRAQPFSLLCFARGSRIATPSGETAVETLRAGDLVTTADGRAVPVKWIGRQAVGGAAGMHAGRAPVRISAGALGEGLPLRDLVVTSDHALLLDGVLVQAGALVNGATISRLKEYELRAGMTVFHIETENHEIVLAEGTPAETFVDNVTRRAFDNYAEFEALYGARADAVVERDEPRAMSARQVPASVRARIAAAAAEGLALAA